MVVLASQISLLLRRWIKPQKITVTIQNVRFKMQCLQWCPGCVHWPDLAGVHSEETIQEDKNANQGGGDQHAGVPAQPCKVKTYLLTKVPPARETEQSNFTYNLRWLLVKSSRVELICDMVVTCVTWHHISQLKNNTIITWPEYVHYPEHANCNIQD